MARILILDDDFTLAKSWRTALEANNHSVDLSYSSSEAIAYAKANTYDLYIIDLFIPSHEVRSDSGRLLLVHLRTSHDRDELTQLVIGVSGFLTEFDSSVPQMLFEAFGVKTFFRKPFTAEDLAHHAQIMLDA